MTVEIDPRELLEFDVDHGVFRCAGERALILNAGALGLLRKELIETMGMRVARRLLTRFGYAHGWRSAEALKALGGWGSEEELSMAGARLHAMQGLLVFRLAREMGHTEPGAVWHFSYEAEEHLAQMGQSDVPVCWTLCGFASGFLSCAHGREFFSVEQECIARGDSLCRVSTRPLEKWGPELEEHLPYFRGEKLDESLERMTRALKRTETRLRARTRALAQMGAEVDEVSGLVARSEPMRRVLELARRVARVDSTVLLTGRSGSGKERVARLIHDSSPRAHGPFVALNCGAVTESLLESELFGHARGAFTGAVQDRPGLFEAAHGGTLFLDEVGEVPPGMQVKLLRALQEREVRRVGENRSRPVDVRVLAATHRDLAGDVAAGRFREDLYFRLKVVELKLPSLQERREDLLPLARVLLDEAARRLKRPMEGLSPEASAALMRYGWPGNVRELQNALERAVALATGPRIELEDLPEELRARPTRATPARATQRLEDVEREHILAVLDAHGGNQTLAARALGIGTTTLYRKLKLYRGPLSASAL
jgi:transcriptional regulator with PAS, ATPase and Fis domain